MQYLTCIEQIRKILKETGCEKVNIIAHSKGDMQEVYYQSFGSWMKYPTGGRFPLNMTTLLVKHFDGRNDGLVGETSFPWGSKYTYLQNDQSYRGISHGDMVDLNRENIPGFDVREFYVQLVSELRDKGF